MYFTLFPSHRPDRCLDEVINLVSHMASPPLCLSPVSAEIEAKEACTWLRAAGFPQYAQLYEGMDPQRDHTTNIRLLSEPQ